MVERADGARIAVLINIDPLLDAQGKLVGAINCFQDVTERKHVLDALDRSQQDLRQQEQRWNATYEHAAIGIVETDAEGRFLRVNEAICAITGLSREQLLGWRLFARTHPGDRDVDEELYRRQVAGDIGFYSLEKRFVRNDGRMIWIAVRSSTVRDVDGSFLYGVRVVQDITERKEAEERQKLLDRRAQPSRQEHARDRAVARHPDRARHRFAGGLPPGVRGPPDRAQPGARPADAAALAERRSARHRRGGDGALRQPRARPDRVRGRSHYASRPRIALTLALAVHELTTNAAKYGALSMPDGPSSRCAGICERRSQTASCGSNGASAAARR